jgi:hypothetical protein
MWGVRGMREGKKRTLTRAPITPREVSLRYSNGRVFEVVFRNGYKNNGICAVIENQKVNPNPTHTTQAQNPPFKNNCLVSGCEATH